MRNEEYVKERINEVQGEDTIQSEIEEPEDEDPCEIDECIENCLPYETYEAEKVDDDAINEVVCDYFIEDDIDTLLGKINRESYKQILELVKNNNYDSAFKIVDFLNVLNRPDLEDGNMKFSIVMDVLRSIKK